MKNFKSKPLTFVLCMVLIVAMALCMTACGETADTEEQPPVEVSFIVEVVDAEGNAEYFDITTDKATVGEALLAEGLIAGENGQYGLYVTEVNGIVCDYDADGSWWGFYINGQSAPTGVDGTDVESGAQYSFKVER